MNENEKTAAIILSGGSGVRFGDPTPKQFLKIAGKTLLEHTIGCFDHIEEIDLIVIPCVKEFIEETKRIISTGNFNKKIDVIAGGETRQDSSYNSLIFLKDKGIKNVLIHDAIRPFLDERIITELIESLQTYSSIDVAIPLADTLIKVDSKTDMIEEIPERIRFRRGQTPQAFHFDTILQAHEIARKENFKKVTDDCGLVLHYNLGKVFVVQGSTENIKITYPLDLALADEVFRLRRYKIESLDEEKISSKINGTVSVVYGGTSGIGLEISEQLKCLGSHVYSLSKRNGNDITSRESVEKTLRDIYSREGKIDHVIITAGVLDRGDLKSKSYDDIIAQIESNYLGSIYVVKESLKFLKKGGKMILFGSSSSSRGRATYSIYSSTKAALVNFVQAVSEEIYKDGISINLISPARTKTPLREKNFGDEPEGTLLDPKMVARKTVELLCDDVTGQIFNVRKE